MLDGISTVAFDGGVGAGRSSRSTRGVAAPTSVEAEEAEAAAAERVIDDDGASDASMFSSSWIGVAFTASTTSSVLSLLFGEGRDMAGWMQGVGTE